MDYQNVRLASYDDFENLFKKAGDTNHYQNTYFVVGVVACSAVSAFFLLKALVYVVLGRAEDLPVVWEEYKAVMGKAWPSLLIGAILVIFSFVR